jgi:hypothetical protein
MYTKANNMQGAGLPQVRILTIVLYSICYLISFFFFYNKRYICYLISSLSSFQRKHIV